MQAQQRAIQPLGLNESIVVGELSAEPERRTLPSGAVGFSFSLRVRRPGEKTASVPVVWYDPPKRADKWVVGDFIVVVGSVVRRFYQGGSGLGSSTEVVVQSAHAAARRAPIQKILRKTLSDIETALALGE